MSLLKVVINIATAFLKLVILTNPLGLFQAIKTILIIIRLHDCLILYGESKYKNI